MLKVTKIQINYNSIVYLITFGTIHSTESKLPVDSEARHEKQGQCTFVPMVKCKSQECCQLLLDLQCCHHHLEVLKGFTFSRPAML